ncbi:MAG TPA: hypothetical protein VKQ07_09170, partial [Jatrophihabitantaceae bacterium]|nr:hypothetical protein [Jatrophihabitantaceae bacterium]
MDELLASAWQRRVVLIAAGPGYGKSTALDGLQGVVVQLGSTDRSLDDLVTRVRSALRVESGTPIEDVVVGADDPVALAETQAAHICAAVEGRGDELLILDEVERIAADDGAVAFLRALCLQAPSGLHVVLSGRVIPSMGLGEAAGRGEVVRIGATELAFDPDEVSDLVAQRLGTIDHTLAAAISARTGGWPAAVCLLLDAMSRVGDRADLVARLSGDSAPWRDFATEIVAALPEDTCALLTAAAVAGTAEPKVLAALGVRSSSATLAELVDRGLLVPTESAARVSDVLVGALLSAAEPAAADTWRERAAAWFEQQHRLAEALDCHSAGSAAELTEFLTRCGHQLVMSGAGRRVADELRATGVDASTDVLLGEALWAAGDWDGAYDVFMRMRSGTSGMPAAAAWRFGSLLYLRGDVDVAVEVLTAAQDGEPSDLALASAWLASALWSRGDVDDAAAAGARADADALSCGDARARAAAQVAIALVAASRGDRERNAQAYRVALSAATDAGDSLQAARILANLASRAMEEGDYPAAIEHADRAMQVGAGHRFFTALALTNKSEALLRLGEIDAARTAAAEALDFYTALGSLHAASALVQLAEIQRQGGDDVQARLAFERAARMAEAGGDAHTTSIAYLGLAWLLATQEPAAAVAYARDAVERASSLELPAALVAQAWAELHGEHPEEVDRLARQAEAQARDTGDRPALIAAIQLRAVATDPPTIALLDEALAVCEQIGDPLASIRARLAIAAATGDTAEVDVQRRLLSDRGAAELGIATLLVNRLAGRTGSVPSITTLGAFAVTLGGRPVPANAWQSRKARDLLKLLIAHDGRP